MTKTFERWPLTSSYHDDCVVAVRDAAAPREWRTKAVRVTGPAPIDPTERRFIAEFIVIERPDTTPAPSEPLRPFFSLPPNLHDVRIGGEQWGVTRDRSSGNVILWAPFDRGWVRGVVPGRRLDTPYRALLLRSLRLDGGPQSPARE